MSIKFVLTVFLLLLVVSPHQIFSYPQQPQETENDAGELTSTAQNQVGILKNKGNSIIIQLPDVLGDFEVQRITLDKARIEKHKSINIQFHIDEL
jgi:hypothetical protein